MYFIHIHMFFHTYPDAIITDEDLQPVVDYTRHYTVFARYDAWDEYGCSSGRAVYVTNDKQDALDVWDKMNSDDLESQAADFNHTEQPSDDHYYGVRRGGITEYRSLEEAWASPEVAASDNIDWAEECAQYAPSGPIMAAWLRGGHSPAQITMDQYPVGLDITPPEPVFQGPVCPPVQGPEEYYGLCF